MGCGSGNYNQRTVDVLRREMRLQEIADDIDSGLYKPAELVQMHECTMGDVRQAGVFARTSYDLRGENVYEPGNHNPELAKMEGYYCVDCGDPGEAKPCIRCGSNKRHRFWTKAELEKAWRYDRPDRDTHGMATMHPKVTPYHKQIKNKENERIREPLSHEAFHVSQKRVVKSRSAKANSILEELIPSSQVYDEYGSWCFHDSLM